MTVTRRAELIRLMRRKLGQIVAGRRYADALAPDLARCATELAGNTPIGKEHIASAHVLSLWHWLRSVALQDDQEVRHGLPVTFTEKTTI